MLSRFADFFTHKRGLRVYYYPEINQAPICMDYKPGETIKPPECISKEGFVIEGWYRSKRFTNRKVINLKCKLLGEISLYAKWKPKNET